MLNYIKLLNMYKTPKINIIVLLMISFLGFNESYAQDKEDKKMNETLAKVNKWRCKKVLVDGKEINLDSTNIGVVTMEFSVLKKRKIKKITTKKGVEKNKKVLEMTNVFKIEMSGNDRIFNYNIKNDSIQFMSVKGFNDYKIISINDTELLLEHVLNKSKFSWVMIPIE